MSQKVVSDTGPLISWARAGLVPLLRDLTGEISIPKAVAQELRQPGRPGSQLLTETWVKEVSTEISISNFPPMLGNGERQAIALAEKLGALVLLDDSGARKEAERRGLGCLSTLRLLTQAKGEGLLEQVKPVLEVFINQGFWLSDAVSRRYLASLGEL